MAELTIGTKVKHHRYGVGIIGGVDITSYDIYFEIDGKIQFTKSNTDIEVIEEVENEVENDVDSNRLSLNEIEKVLTYVLDKYNSLEYKVDLGDKWLGGKMLLQPANESLKPKEIPIETFFHKIVMLRDRLRVLEQNINSHKVLNDEEKVRLQQYITSIYGSLTTFNVLFDDKEDYFVGAKKK